MNLQHVLERLDTNGILVSIRDEWDCGWCVRLCNQENPLVESLEEAARWLHETAVRRYPDSEYALSAEEIERYRPAAGYELPCVMLGLYESEYRVGIASARGKIGWVATLNLETKHLLTLDAAAQWLIASLEVVYE